MTIYTLLVRTIFVLPGLIALALAADIPNIVKLTPSERWRNVVSPTVTIASASEIVPSAQLVLSKVVEVWRVQIHCEGLIDPSAALVTHKL